MAVLASEELSYFRVTQIREKFGELRYYWKGKDSVLIESLIEKARIHSRRICMECGAPGALCRKGGVKTLCTFCIGEVDIRNIRTK